MCLYSPRDIALASFMVTVLSAKFEPRYRIVGASFPETKWINSGRNSRRQSRLSIIVH